MPVKTHPIVHFKYVQFLVWKLYLYKAVKEDEESAVFKKTEVTDTLVVA